MSKQDQSKAPEKTTSWELADRISGIAGYALSMVDVMCDQVDSTGGQAGNIIALLDCTERYLNDIQKLCEEAQKGGA